MDLYLVTVNYMHTNNLSRLMFQSNLLINSSLVTWCNSSPCTKSFSRMPSVFLCTLSCVDHCTEAKRHALVEGLNLFEPNAMRSGRINWIVEKLSVLCTNGRSYSIELLDSRPEISLTHKLLCIPNKHEQFFLATFLFSLQVMKTYHMYQSESISAESKLKEAEKQEEKQIGRGDPVFSIRTEDKYQKRNSVKKIEKMKEKVGYYSRESHFSAGRAYLWKICLPSGSFWDNRWNVHWKGIFFFVFLEYSVVVGSVEI